MPVSRVCLARLTFLRPTFWETKEAIDCIRALGIEHGEIDDLAGYTVAGGRLQSQAVDKRTQGQEGKLGQKLLQRERQPDGKKLLALGVEPEILPW